MDLKKYKERLETIIKNFNLQVDNNTKANMKYTNEIKDKTERNSQLRSRSKESMRKKYSC